MSKKRNRSASIVRSESSVTNTMRLKRQEVSEIETHMRRGQYAEAERLTRETLGSSPDDALFQQTLGKILCLDGRAEEALKYFRCASACAESPSLANDIGIALKSLGQFTEAEDAFRRAIAKRRNFTDALFNLSELKKFHIGDPDIALLKQAADSRLNDKDEVRIQFALAKALDDCGEHEAAFESLERANNLKRQGYEYDPSLMEALISQTIDVFSAGFWRRRKLQRAISGLRWGELLTGSKPATEEAPIFIVGMPRSGTTLIEQILASHEQVHAVGERNEFKNLIVRRLSEEHGSATSLAYPHIVQDLSDKVLEKCGRIYLGAVGSRCSASVKVVDKTPMNFLFLGLIKMIWPNAKVIHCDRDPIATCFSCYQRLFSGDQPFAYSQVELGRYHRHYAQLMQHWHSTLSDTVIRVRYEDVIADTELSIRRILKHCNLPWSDRCLEFHRTDRTVLTASSVQVRQPIYTSSLQQWVNYQAQLQPLLTELEK